MSNGEVKRWYIYSSEDGALYAVNKNQRGFVPDATTIAAMPVEDHERIVAGLQAQIKRFINAEIIRAEYQGFTYGQALDTIASQKRVIAILRQQRNVAHERAKVSADELMQFMREDDDEITAIEKGEA